jgi:hypothetical protein
MAGPRGFPTELSHGADDVELRVPLGSGDELVGWLTVEYTKRDPLVVSITVCSPSHAVVLDRTILRSDLRSGIQRPVRYSTVVVEPAPARNFTSFQFEERLVIVTAMVPTDVLSRFLRESDEIVPPGRSETEVVSSMLADLLQDSDA